MDPYVNAGYKLKTKELNNNNLLYSNLRNDDNLIQQTMNKEIEKHNKIVDDTMTKGNNRELFMCCMRDQ